MNKNDFLWIGAAMLIALFLFFGFQAHSDSTQKKVEIRENGTVTYSLPLSENARIPIQNGVHQNIVVIENGTVRMESANCPDKLCMRQGRQSAGGIPIVCLPNRVSVSIVNDSDAPDTVTH